ncbi:MAG: NFACT RNA binding domain-containing protein, partial [candidate division WOR-3 bacterium]
GRIYFRPPIADKGERPLYPFTKDIEKELNFREVKSIEKDLFSPYVWVSGGKIYPFSPSFCNAERIDDVIAFLAADFGDFYERRNFETKKSELAHVLKKRIEKLREVVLKSKIEVPSDKEIEDLYRWGVTLFTCYKEAVRDGDNYIIPDPYSEGDFLKVPIEVELDPISLANYYFEKRSLLKKKKAHLSKRLADFELEVKWLEEMLWDLENAKELEDLNRIAEILAEVGLLKEGSKKVYGKSTDDRNNYTEFDYGKYKVYVGRNARGNEYVTFKLAKPNDLWFHVKDYPGAHVVVRVVTDFNEEDLKKVAGIALYYSKVRSAGKGDVDYTYVRNVKKIRGKVGMVTYKDYKTVRVEVYKPEGEDHD